MQAFPDREVPKRYDRNAAHRNVEFELLPTVRPQNAHADLSAPQPGEALRFRPDARAALVRNQVLPPVSSLDLDGLDYSGFWQKQNARVNECES